MKSVIPTIIMIMGITILTLVASCLISFQLQLSTARDFQNNCVDRIQASDFSDTVTNECVSKASENGYTLTVIDQTINENRPCKLVQLTYTAKMPLLGNLSKESTIESYAK